MSNSSNSTPSSPVPEDTPSPSQTKEEKEEEKTEPVKGNDDDDKEDKATGEQASNKSVETMTSLPTVITDEEGASIPEASNGSSMYHYRDFSNVPEEELERQPSTAPPPAPANRGPVESSIRVQKFPVKLYAILAKKEFQDIITWMPHGRSWKVLKPNLFESLVMPLFFEYSNYHSFNRLVNAWSFRRISSGPDRGSYYHELFLRGKPYLQKYMRRLPKTHKKLPMKKDDEPDFYAMDKENPLPSVEDAPLPPGMTSGDGANPIGFPHGAGGPFPTMGMGMGPVGMNPAMASRLGPGAGAMPMGGFDEYAAMGGGGMAGMGPGAGMPGSLGMNHGPHGGMPGMMGMSGPPMMQHGMMQHGGMGMNPAQRAFLAQEQRAFLGMEGGMMGGPMNMGISPMAGGMGGYSGHGASGDMEFQRIRQIQQMHMLDRQRGNSSVAGMGGDPLDRMRNMEMRLGR